MSCESNQDCSGDTAVCDVSGTRTCVQCMPGQDDACRGSAPACVNNTCQACTAHGQCDSQVCLIDDGGTCADSREVAYADPRGTDNTDCTIDTPCTKIGSALGTARPYVKLAGRFDEAVVITDQDVTLVAEPGARLTRTQSGAILEIAGTSQVKIFDLEISGGLGIEGIGISLVPGSSASVAVTRAKISDNRGGGIGNSNGSLTVSRSEISANQGGGIAVAGPAARFDITNSFIVRNGDELVGSFGGLLLGIVTPGSYRLEFNTIADNKAAYNSAGIVCNISAFIAPNNIIARNNLAGDTNSPTAQVKGSGCVYPSSRIQGDVMGLMFEHPDPPGMLSYKLVPGSTAIDQATTPSSIETDHDGDPRPSGNGKDIGADELQR